MYTKDVPRKHKCEFDLLRLQTARVRDSRGNAYCRFIFFVSFFFFVVVVVVVVVIINALGPRPPTLFSLMCDPRLPGHRR